MRNALVFLTILGSSAGAPAQERPGAGEIPIEATEYNLALAQKHGATGARLQIVPSLSPGHAGLTARVSF